MKGRLVNLRCLTPNWSYRKADSRTTSQHPHCQKSVKSTLQHKIQHITADVYGKFHKSRMPRSCLSQVKAKEASKISKYDGRSWTVSDMDNWVHRACSGRLDSLTPFFTPRGSNFHKDVHTFLSKSRRYQDNLTWKENTSRCLTFLLMWHLSWTHQDIWGYYRTVICILETLLQGMYPYQREHFQFSSSAHSLIYRYLMSFSQSIIQAHK